MRERYTVSGQQIINCANPTLGLQWLILKGTAEMGGEGWFWYHGVKHHQIVPEADNATADVGLHEWSKCT
jgi:hypothetical protein